MSGWASLVGQQIAAEHLAGCLVRAARGEALGSPVEEPTLELEDRTAGQRMLSGRKRNEPERDVIGVFSAALAKEVARTDASTPEAVVYNALRQLARQGWTIDVEPPTRR